MYYSGVVAEKGEVISSRLQNSIIYPVIEDTFCRGTKIRGLINNKIESDRSLLTASMLPNLCLQTAFFNISLCFLDTVVREHADLTA